MPSSRYIFAAGPLTVSPPIMGETAKTLPPTPLPVKNLQDRIDTYPGIGWTDDDGVCGADRFAHTGSWFRFLNAFEAKAFYLWLASAVYKIFLKGELSFIGINDGPDFLVRHRQDSRAGIPQALQKSRVMSLRH